MDQPAKPSGPAVPWQGVRYKKRKTTLMKQRRKKKKEAE